MGGMRITIESTTKIVEVNGVPARVWEGHSERGIKLIAVVTRIGVDKAEDTSQFEAELQEHKAPSPVAQSFGARFLID